MTSVWRVPGRTAGRARLRGELLDPLLEGRHLRGRRGAACMAMSLVMSPSTLILPAMNACIAAWGLASTNSDLATSWGTVIVVDAPSAWPRSNCPALRWAPTSPAGPSVTVRLMRRSFIAVGRLGRLGAEGFDGVEPVFGEELVGHDDSWLWLLVGDSGGVGGEVGDELGVEASAASSGIQWPAPSRTTKR